MSLRIYFALGIAIAFLALGGVALWYRGQAISAVADAAQARADLNAVVATNHAQAETIGRLRATSAANDRIVATMAEYLAAINAAVTDTNKQIGDLKDANEDVRAFLAGRVPPELERLLNK